MEAKSHRKKKSNGTYCCVVNCHRNTAKDQGIVSFFRFPKSNPEQRQEWIKAVHRRNQDGSDWIPNTNTRICSDHFVSGWWSRTRDDPDYKPTKFPTRHVQEKSEQDVQRYERFKARSLSQDFQHFSIESDLEKDGRDFVETIAKASQTEIELGFSRSGAKIVYEGIDNEMALDDVSGKIVYNKGTQFSTQSFSETGVGTSSIIVKDFGHSAPRGTLNILEPSLMTDRQFKSFFGITKNLFNFMLDFCDEISDSTNITRESKLALFLAKLKMNPSFSALSGMFGVTEHAAKSHFVHVLPAMVNLSKTGVIWYSKDVIKARLPPSFRALYPDCRVIIDCSEIPCEKPGKLKQRTLLYSNYKSRHTLKFLVGCAPSGEITFISETYGGRATDTEITVRSGLLSLIEDGDTILADKGFPRIECDVNANGGVLVMPPFKQKNNPFSSAENRSAYQCASVRVHVERCIARMKVFECLHFVSLDLFPFIDDILYVISYLCNMGNDLIKQD